MNKTLLRRAAHHADRLRKMQADYEAECEDYRADGYRPHYCIHGTNQWTDYDNICGPCEDGYGRYEGLVLYELALAWAHRDLAEVEQRTQAIMPLAAHRNTLPADVWVSLTTWALTPITDQEA